jgi:uridine phosphorylase
MDNPHKLPIIESSELIINEHGAIYHLNLTPEQLADTVITVGDPARVHEVSKHFDEITHKAQHREFITHTGRVGQKHISVVSTGIGTGNIDIVLNELDALVNVDFHTRMVNPVHQSLNIVRLGTCGTLQEDVAIDSIVVSSYAVGLDNLLHYYKFTENAEESHLLGEFERHTGLATRHIHPYVVESAIALRSLFSGAFTHGITATCPGFYGPQARSIRLDLSVPNLLDALASFRTLNHRIVNFEMETSAIYGLGKLLGHRCLSVSAVVANRARKTFSANHAKAVEHLIVNALSLLEQL